MQMPFDEICYQHCGSLFRSCRLCCSTTLGWSSWQTHLSSRLATLKQSSTASSTPSTGVCGVLQARGSRQAGRRHLFSRRTVLSGSTAAGFGWMKLGKVPCPLHMLFASVAPGWQCHRARVQRWLAMTILCSAVFCLHACVCVTACGVVVHTQVWLWPNDVS